MKFSKYYSISSTCFEISMLETLKNRSNRQRSCFLDFMVRKFTFLLYEQRTETVCSEQIVSSRNNSNPNTLSGKCILYKNGLYGVTGANFN